MAESSPRYNTRAIRELLLAAFTAEELRRFCQDRPAFRPILADVGPGYSLNQITDEVITYCATRNLFDELLAQVKEANPRQYARLAPDLCLPATTLPEAACPYRGLEPFQAEHAEFFFGREAMVEKLVAKVDETNFVAVVGPSGCGKSSLVQAGLVPALRIGALTGSRQWGVEAFRPGTDPLRSLAWAFVRHLEPEAGRIERLEKARRLADQMSRGDLSLDDLLFTVRERLPSGARLLLIADQFEETFTACQDEELRRAFMETLVAAAAADPLAVLLTLRADFYGHVLGEPGLDRLVDEGLFNVLNMNREELQAAIERPAVALGRSFEPGLVERILDDVAAAPGRLPLLEFALTLLWQRRTAQGVLSHAAYKAIGEVSGAIAQHADGVLADLEPEEQEQVRQIFTGLVRVARPDEGAEDTRRRVSFKDLDGEVQPLVGALADTRLIVTGRDPASGETAIELAHEALVRNWQQLRDWLDADREFLLWRQRLRSDVRRWEQSKRDPGALLSGGLLAEAERWHDERSVGWSPVEAEYLAASVARREDRERRRQEEEAHLRQARARAERNERVARARELAAFALNVLVHGEDPSGSLALLLAREAVLTTLNAGEEVEKAAWDALHRATTTSSPSQRMMLQGHMDMVSDAAFSSDGTRIVTASVDGTARVWDAGNGRELLQLKGHEKQGSIPGVAFSPDGRRIVTGSGCGVAWVWDAASGQESLQLQGHKKAVLRAAFSPDGRRIVTASLDKTARVWDAASGQELLKLQGHKKELMSAAFSPDGRRILTASLDGTARVWDAAGGQELLELWGHKKKKKVINAAFSPDGRRIVTTISDEAARVWDADSGEELLQLQGHGRPSLAVAFSPDGARIVATDVDNTARVWDANSGQELLQLRGHTDVVYAASFSPDGTRIVTASGDKTARLWDPRSVQEPLELPGHAREVWAAAFSPDGTRIITAGRDGTARVWDASSGQELLRLATSYWIRTAEHAAIALAKAAHTLDLYHPELAKEHQVFGATIMAAAFSPDGTRIVTGAEDNTARLWDASDGQELLKVRGHTDWIWTAVFSPDGTRIVTASDDKTARVWDASSGQEILQLQGHTAGVNAAAFDRDGTRIVTASDDKTARVWDASSGQELLQLRGHTDGVCSAAFSPDGSHPEGGRIATSGRDGTVRLWDAASGQEVLQLQGHVGGVRAVSFSPNGRRIVTAGEDTTARLWDAGSGQELLQLQGHGATVLAAAFNPDGTRIVTASSDGTTRTWLIDADTLLAVANSRIQRVPPEFTPEERRRFLHEE